MDWVREREERREKEERGKRRDEGRERRVDPTMTCGHHVSN